MAVARSKDVTNVRQASEYLPYDTLFEALVKKQASAPKDNGTVSLLVQRPKINERVLVPQVELTIEGGMEGSGWEERPERGTIDQICVMSTRAIRVISDSEDHDVWAAAGDQVFMDMDLSKQNFATGDRVVVGGDDGVILQVTSKPHNGCPKFSKRYGADALKVVNCPEAKQLRLRGIYFHVHRGGTVKEGDSIRKVDPSFGGNSGSGFWETVLPEITTPPPRHPNSLGFSG